MTITLDQLTEAVANESLEAACQRQPHFTAHVLRSRAEGHPFRDFAHGTLDAVLELPEGRFTLRIRWRAEGQYLVEHGWVYREAPHLNGGGIFSDVAILDEDGAPLTAEQAAKPRIARGFFVSHPRPSCCNARSLQAAAEPQAGSSLGRDRKAPDRQGATGTDRWRSSGASSHPGKRGPLPRRRPDAPARWVRLERRSPATHCPHAASMPAEKFALTRCRPSRGRGTKPRPR